MNTRQLHIETPLIESHALSARAQRSVWLKLESSQPCGSFKIRGIGHACNEHARRGARRFVLSSGGNAGIAAAYAGRCLEIPVTVVVPQTTTQRAKDLIRQENGEVIVHGASWQEANAMAHSLLGERDVSLHPFDDPWVWEGHATLVDEVARSGVKPDAIVLCVGGGGLLCGVAEGLRRNNWADIPIFAVETRGADSYAQALQARHRVELPSIASIATSLGARKVCQQAFDLAQRHPVHSVVVSDLEAVQACMRFFEDHRTVVEPACGASLAMVHDHSTLLRDYQTVLVVVCGGTGVTLGQLEHWRQQLDAA
jgi:L-serine/L-threonine ammonia-lyase